MEGRFPEGDVIHQVERVHALIEYCLMHYMSRRQTADCLDILTDIDPIFTEIIWDHLQEQNPEFFRAYYIRLVLRDHIVRFNELMSLQNMNQSSNAINGLHSNTSLDAQMHQQQQLLNGGNAPPQQPLMHQQQAPVLMHQQQQPLMHQQQSNGSNGILHHSNNSQTTMHRKQNGSNGLLHPSDGSQTLHQQQNGDTALDSDTSSYD